MLVISVAIIAVVVATDQITKRVVMNVIGDGGKPIAVVERFFYIACHRNSGAAWGVLKNGRVFFLILTPVLLVAMIYFLARGKDAFLRTALSFIVGGAIGNFIDRAFVGSVVDFLDFYIFGYKFPTFNAADSSIVLGAGLIIFYTLFTQKGRKLLSSPDSAAPAGPADIDDEKTPDDVE